MITHSDENLLDALLLEFATVPQRFKSFLGNLQGERLRQAVEALLSMYMEDLNSSTLRERVTLLVAGYEPSDKKLGYNGVKGQIKVEVKPVNIRSHGKDKLNGGGNFSDLTPERLAKLEAEGANLHLLVSGFVDGRMVYVLEFPFSCPTFIGHLRTLLHKRWPTGRRSPGEYYRSASFSFKHYKDCPDLKVIWRNPQVETYQRYLTRELYQYLHQIRIGGP
ncbi:MAG: hypothetical protein NZ951_06595 [Dehalococcoidia bacterium]|nr:hypothetical protein [Dehalococcoidia bacterium]